MATSSAGLCPLVSRNAHFEAVTKALNVFVGRGKRYSYKEVQNGAGIPERMIECYKHLPDHEDWRAIKPEELASLFRFIGPEFTGTYLAAIADQGAFWLPTGVEPPGALAADSAEDTAIVTRAAADGRFDEGEVPALRVVGLRMIERGQRLAAA